MIDDRFRRPDLPRKGPDRRFANVLNAAGAADRPDDAPASDAAGDAPEFVAEGVRNAYRVIDAYVAQGQKVARSLGIPAYEPVAQDQWNELTARWVQASSELVAVYVEIMTALTEGMAKPPFRPAAGNGAGGEPTAVGVDYDIKTSLAARPRAEFLPGRATTRLASHGLRSMGNGESPLEVSFRTEEPGRVVIKIRVGKGQEPGLYTGALLDADTGETVGSLSLKLS